VLDAGGRAGAAQGAYRGAVEIYEELWKANREHVEIIVGYVTSLCNVGRWNEAEERVDQLLARVPRHTFANQVKQHIVANRPRRRMPAAAPPIEGSTHTPATTHPISKPWWKRWLGGK
jgi:thioredoxin-like negative regulator of GroEL